MNRNGNIKLNCQDSLNTQYLELYEAIWERAIKDDNEIEPERLIDEVVIEIFKFLDIYNEDFEVYKKLTSKNIEEILSTNKKKILDEKLSIKEKEKLEQNIKKLKSCVNSGLKEYIDKRLKYSKLAINIFKVRTNCEQSLEDKLQEAINNKVLKEGLAWPKAVDYSEYNHLFFNIRNKIAETIKLEIA